MNPVRMSVLMVVLLLMVKECVSVLLALHLKEQIVLVCKVILYYPHVCMLAAYN